MEWTSRSPTASIFVSLAQLRDPGLVLPAVARALGVRDEGDRPPAERLREALRTRELLLVLDNLEQVAAAGPALAGLLDACPAVALLLTSRAPLRVRGEHVLPVPPLPVPDLARLPAAAELARNDAVRLILQRAQGDDPDFDLSAANAPAVAEICVRLDGLPLALELAAARLQVLSPAALLARLTSRLTLLTRGARDLPDRQRTLRATIAWSDDLLGPNERAVFRRLAVFAGGCDAAAGEAVAGPHAPGASSAAERTSVSTPEQPPSVAPSAATLDALAELHDNGLLQRTVVAGEPRFTMLETIREYALDQLEASGELVDVAQTHAAYFLDLAERAVTELRGPEQVSWFERLETEHDNL